jgi:protein-tyrosine phosphatase
VVDLTSEFSDARLMRESRGIVAEYLCLPTLDAWVSEEEAFRAALDRVAAADGPVYIHCAQGHGRSGTFAAALLLRRGIARDVDDAVRMLRARRPGVRLNRRQRKFLQQLTERDARAAVSSNP